ncbi:glycerophosphodiester phosphodiesterase family protein [Mucilaginibacter sp. PAMB04168]|uniref:glycerophosphodiester phosphodiesterase family protein n=1 Tax=Mucilaginibacter sp. PAMB04168 TaxID=3138567 RepID=UPI0031F605DD
MKAVMSFAIIALMLAAHSSNAQKAAPAFPVFDTEAHRGGRGLQPENTIPAMLNAVALGVTTLEMDAHITADGKVVLSHDDAFNPLFALTEDGKEITKADAHKYALYRMKYADIARFDVGSKPYDKFPQQQKLKAHIPLLADVIDSVQAKIKKAGKPQVFYNIETKSKPEGDGIYNPDPEKFVQLLMEVIEKKKITPYIVIQSFDKRTIQVLHQKYPQVKTSFLVENKNTLESNLTDIGFTPYIYSPNYKLVTADMVKTCHQKGIKVIPWTVNTLEEIAALKALGVDGIISDYPNLLVK